MNSLVPVIGIDFGTSNSKMAWYNLESGQAEVLKNMEGEELTPSAVYFDEHQPPLVGSPALDMLQDEQAWDKVVLSVKRSMVNVPMISLADRMVKPVEVVAEILRKLRQDAKEFHFYQEVMHAVITCPASFDGLERDKLKNAAELAGFSKVELLPEPLAAALAYTQIRKNAGLQLGQHVLIYDLGGGTFDLAVLVRDGNEPYRLGLEPQGIRQCGGDDFDEALYNYCDKLAQEKLGRPINLMGLRDLHFLYECRKRKENLTYRLSHTFSSFLQPGPVSFRYEIDRATFEQLIHEKVEHTVQLTSSMVEQASASGYGIDTVVLVGGASQTPLVKRLLGQNLSQKPVDWQHRDVAVALGAAFHAYNIWNTSTLERPKGPSLTVKLPERSELKQYRDAVKAAWSAKKVDQKGVDRLSSLATQLGLSKDEAVNIEIEVMGYSKEAILSHQLEDEYTNFRNFTLAGILVGHKHTVLSVAISPNGQILASSSQDKTIRVWDLHTKQLLRILTGHTGGVRAIAISPDGQFLVSSSIDKTIKLWNLSTGVPLYTFTGPAGQLADSTSLAISPNGQLLVSGSADGQIKFWNLGSRRWLPLLVGHGGSVESVAFSPDGRLLASGSADRTVKLWNLNTGRLLHTFTGYQDEVRSIAFSPNGQLLASTGNEPQTVTFWHWHTGVLLRPLIGHTNSVQSIAFSPSGYFLASCSADRTVKLWNLRTGQLTNNLTGHTGSVCSVAFSPDGHILVSGSTDKTIRIWSKS